MTSQTHPRVSPSPTRTHPPIDPELASAMADPTLPPPSMLAADIPARRAAAMADAELLTRDGAITVEHVILEGPAGHPELPAVVLRPTSLEDGDQPYDEPAPGLLYLHGGGMVLGDALGIEATVVDTVLRGCTVVSPQYRLAPEHPYPAAVDDCLAAWRGMVEQATELGVDPARLSIAGSSAGGGLAAGATLAARDRGLAMPQHQMLLCPMLDDREITASSHELDGVGRWDRTANRTAWSAYLGEARGTDAVPIYAAPARATDLAALPPTFIDVGAVDTFRDEDIDYAARLSRAGVPVELHVWPGAVHGFTTIAPDAAISRAAIRARMQYLARAVLAA